MPQLLVILICAFLLSFPVRSAAAPFDWIYQFDSPAHGFSTLPSPVAVQHPANLDNRDATLIATTFATDDVGLSQRGLLVWQCPGMAIQIPLLVVSGIPETIDQNGHGLQTGEFSDVEGGLIVAFGGAVLPNLSAGLNAKLLGHSVLQEKAFTAGLDGELVWHSRGLSLGIMIANLSALPLTWRTGHADTLPLEVSAQLDFQLMPGLSGGISAWHHAKEMDMSIYAGYSFAELVTWSVKATRQNDLLIVDNACRIQLSDMGILCQMSTHPDLGNRFQAGVVLALDHQSRVSDIKPYPTQRATPSRELQNTEQVFGSEYRMVRYR